MKGRPALQICTRGHSMARYRKRSPNGDSYCSECKNIRHKTFRRNQPARMHEYSRTSNLRRRYGLEREEYNELLLKQNGQCAVCRTDNWGVRGPHVDHCHATGTVRGLLCHKCNTALGLLREDPDLIMQAFDYLKGQKGK